MNQAAFPKPLAKYLAGLSGELQGFLTPLLSQVQQSLALEAAKSEDVLAILAAQPVDKPEQETALLEALARLPHPLMPAVLQAHFGGGADKTRQKALKKALHHLKAQGIEVPAEFFKGSGSAMVTALPTDTSVKAYVSRIEGNGSRMVIFHLPGLGQVINLLVVLANDVEGIKDIYSMPMSNKEVKLYLQHVQDEVPGELAPVDPAYAFGVVEECLQVNSDSSGEAATLYRQVRPLLLSRLGEPPTARLDSLLPPPVEVVGYTTKVIGLLAEEDFSSWLPGPEEMRIVHEKLDAVANSPLHLSAEQKNARVERLLAEALQEVYPPAQRQRFGRWLQHMAYYYYQTSRPELGQVAQAAAADVTRERSSLEQESPFLLTLFTYALELAHEAGAEEEAEDVSTGGRIITDF